MNRQARSLWALASMLLVMGGLRVWILHWRAEEYAVYDAAIREAFSGNGVSYYLILDRTQPAGRFGITNFHSEKLGLSLTTRISYAAKNVFRFRIAPKFHLPYPFRMVAQDEQDRIFRPGKSDSTNVSGLEELLRKSWGVITLSRVGFDAGGKHAVVYDAANLLRPLWRRHLPISFKGSGRVAHCSSRRNLDFVGLFEPLSVIYSFPT